MSTSVPSASPQPAVSTRQFDSLAARVTGVFHSPRATLQAVAAEPRWAGVLALTFVVTAVSSAILLSTDVGQLALVDQWERTAIAFGQEVDDARYAAMMEASTNGLAYAVLTSVLSGPFVVLITAAVLFLVLGGTAGRLATFRQVLAVVAHASVILAARQVVAAPVNYARETLASPTTLSVLFSVLDESSPLARFLGVIDLFVVWWIAVLAVGLSVLYRRPARRLAVFLVGAYIALALALAVVMTLTGGTS